MNCVAKGKSQTNKMKDFYVRSIMQEISTANKPKKHLTNRQAHYIVMKKQILI